MPSCLIGSVMHSLVIDSPCTSWILQIRNKATKPKVLQIVLQHKSLICHWFIIPVGWILGCNAPLEELINGISECRIYIWKSIPTCVFTIFLMYEFFNVWDMLFSGLTTASCICFWEMVVICKTVVSVCAYAYTYMRIYLRLHSHTVTSLVDQ